MRIALVVLGIILGIIIVKLSEKSLHITLDREKELGVTHYFMMGLNEKYNGVFYTEDVLFSESFPTAHERTRQNISTSFDRLSEMGVGRTLIHIGKKILVSFNDGTFAWAAEGGFIHIETEGKNRSIQSFYRNLFYPNGTHYNFFLQYTQCIWISTLSILAVSSFLNKRKEKEYNKYNFSFLKLTVIGFALFEILFEPRARHIFVSLPVLLILASVGFFAIFPIKKQSHQEESNNHGIGNNIESLIHEDAG